MISQKNHEVKPRVSHFSKVAYSASKVLATVTRFTKNFFHQTVIYARFRHRMSRYGEDCSVGDSQASENNSEPDEKKQVEHEEKLETDKFEKM